MAEIGSADRPLRVAIVGAGPSGFYAAAALLAPAPGGAARQVTVDMIDRLPTPFGLVRGGVAPDHQNIKAVIRVYDKTAKNPAFRFLGNVAVGRDVTMDELRAAYDQVVLAVGCESANPLGIPGEDLPGSHSATAFVGWYNGHPDHRDRDFDLSSTTAVVVGVGNVSMDVTRVLVRDRDELAKTDIAHHALEQLRQSKVTDVYVLGRRGPVQAAFSPAEIKEIAELDGVDLVVRPEDLVLDPASEQALASAEKTVIQNMTFLREVAGRTPTAPKRVHLRFLASPVAIRGSDRVEAVEIGRNRLEPGGGDLKARDTGERETIPAGLVFRAVGYRGIQVPGVPFDQKTGTIPNAGGRVTDGGAPVERTYVVGWAKRGPQGLIGTNRGDSKDTVDRMFDDLPTLPNVPRAPLAKLDAHAVGWADWERIDAEEVRRGKDAGKIREKFSRVAEMLAALGRG
ncbi:MAG: FAD-dependent oxidoreductase [Myxococcota bacterium]